MVYPIDDHPREECGVIGIFAPEEDVSRMCFYGLFALQHRGQEGAGIAVSNGHTLRLHKDIGMVSQVFTAHNLAPLQGTCAIAHTRYSTTGSSSQRNLQPFVIETRHGPLALAHNGNLVNAHELRQGLLEKGVGLASSSDTEVMTMMLAGADGDTWEERIQNTMKTWRGAYSVVILTRDQVFALRDPWGFRPLSVGMLAGGGHAAASESCALRTLGCQAIREVEPGEIITLSNTALRVKQALPPDSYWDGMYIHLVRQRLGSILAEEAGVEADVVIPVPDSSIPAAIGYAHRSGIPYNDGFIKNRYIGRTFIEPTDSLRKQGVALKFNVVEENVREKRVIMIDDSIVRGITTAALLQLLRRAGAREVHVCITCPPIRHPCFMGVDMGTYEELIAYHKSEDEICREMKADSLHYLSMAGMMRAVGREEGYCDACFTGRYPVPVMVECSKSDFESAITG